MTVTDVLVSKLACEFAQPQPAKRPPARYVRNYEPVYRLAHCHNLFGPEGTWQNTDVHMKAVAQTAFELIRDLDQRSKSGLM